MTNVWFETDQDAIAHQQAMDVLPSGRYRALALSPIATGRLDPPDVVLLYGTPGQMIILSNGLQFSGFRKFEFASVGESACADSWGSRAAHRRAVAQHSLLRRTALRRRPGR